MGCLQTPTAHTLSFHAVRIASFSPPPWPMLRKQGMRVEKEGEEEAGPVHGLASTGDRSSKTGPTL